MNHQHQQYFVLPQTIPRVLLLLLVSFQSYYARIIALPFFIIRLNFPCASQALNVEWKWWKLMKNLNFPSEAFFPTFQFFLNSLHFHMFHIVVCMKRILLFILSYCCCCWRQNFFFDSKMPLNCFHPTKRETCCLHIVELKNRK